MRLKSYFSGTVEAAMELARKELGEDALLINARPATPETRSLGAFEVVFGTADSKDAGIPPAGSAAALPQLGNLAAELAGLRRQIQAMAQEMAQTMAQTMRESQILHPLHAPRSQAYADLLRQELDPALAAHVAGGKPLDTLFEVDATLGRPGASRAVVALVGPPGAGKTTTLAKLAARYGLASRKPSHVITADVHRIAAAEQLRCLASILGMGCDVVETPVALAQALEEHRGKDMIFIDTPGLASAEMADGADLANFLGAHPEIDVHLVLPASMRADDLASAIDRYQIFRPRKLLFTRLDEAGSFGALVSQAARRSLPISFLATGQQIPDDLEPATKQKLNALVLAGPFGEHVAKGAAA